MRPVFARPIAPGTNFLHVSSQCYNLPLFGADPNVDKLIAEGYLRDIQTVTLLGGREIRVGRSKGVTYRRTAAKPARIGALRRAARRAQA